KQEEKLEQDIISPLETETLSKKIKKKSPKSKDDKIDQDEQKSADVTKDSISEIQTTKKEKSEISQPTEFETPEINTASQLEKSKKVEFKKKESKPELIEQKPVTEEKINFKNKPCMETDFESKESKNIDSSIIQSENKDT